MATPTQKEQIESLKKELDELKEQQEQLLKMMSTSQAKGFKPSDGEEKLVRKDRPGPGGGWAVITPYSGYFGVTAGVRFKSGYGIVDVEREDADRIVHLLENDFGYKVMPMEAEDLHGIRKKIDSFVEPQQTMAEKLSK